jgi:imidazolonepropionase-like amidohydrolase
MTRAAAALAILLCVAATLAQTAPVRRALKAGGYVAPDGKIVNGGVLVFEDGRITQVGGDVPAGVAVDSFPQAVLCPGLVDCYGSLGASGWLTERAGAMQAAARASDAFNRFSTQINAALASGVTTFALVPADDNLVGGEIAICQTSGSHQQPRLLREAGPLKLSLSPEALRVDRPPTSREGALGMLRDALTAATAPTKPPVARNSPDVKGSLPPGFDPTAAPWPAFATGKLPGLVAAPAAADVLAALDLADQFKLNLILVHTQDARRIAEELAGRARGVIVGPLGLDAGPRAATAAGIFAKRDVPVAIAGGLPSAPADSLRLGAAVAARAGLSTEAARRAITAVPAELLGVADDAGTLAERHRADVVVFSGDPLDLRSRVLAVYIAGERVFTTQASPGEPR